MTQKEKINTEELGEKIVKVIKTIFDPNSILNPGKIFA